MQNHRYRRLNLRYVSFSLSHVKIYLFGFYFAKYVEDCGLLMAKLWLRRLCNIGASFVLTLNRNNGRTTVIKTSDINSIEYFTHEKQKDCLTRGSGRSGQGGQSTPLKFAAEIRNCAVVGQPVLTISSISWGGVKINVSCYIIKLDF